jgi:hypothetical protein
MLTWTDRWGGPPDAYTDFARGYGADFKTDRLAAELAAVRLLAPTVNMILNGATSEWHATEARLRMQYWRNDDAAPTWTPQ